MPRLFIVTDYAGWRICHFYENWCWLTHAWPVGIHVGIDAGIHTGIHAGSEGDKDVRTSPRNKCTGNEREN